MALTPSSMLKLGTQLPDFALRDVVSDKTVTNADVTKEKGTVVMFICRHCPYVIHVQDELASLATEYTSKEIGFVAISSNDIQNYPQDAPKYMLEQAKEVGFHFPYLFDETQEVARSFQAECTPDFFVFDENDKLVYRGRLDEATPGNGKPVTGSDLREALNALISEQAVASEQHPSMGCNIKWK